MTWWAVPERFALVLDNVYGQVATDPFSPMSPYNRQNTNFLSTGPDWYIPFGDRCAPIWADGTRRHSTRSTDDDSERLLGIVGVDRPCRSSSRLGVQASTEAVDFDSVLQADFDRHEAYAHYEFSRGQGQPELTVNAGYTWLSGDAGDHSAPLLEVQLSRAGIDQRRSAGWSWRVDSRMLDSSIAAGGLPGSGAGTDPGVIPQAGVFEERSGRVIVDYQRSRTMLSLRRRCLLTRSTRQRHSTVGVTRWT